jgi:hypothetical protein
MRDLRAWVLVVAALTACQTAAPATVTVTPSSITLAPGETATFTATAPGGGSAGVAWSVGCGALDGLGLTVTYTAPPTEGTCTLRAVAVANPAASAEAVVTVQAVPTGDLVWRRQSGTALTERATAVAVAADGGPVVVGFTAGAFGGPSAGGEDLFVARYDAHGNLLARRQHGSGAEDRAAAVALLPSGNAVVVGATFGNLGAPAGGEDAFVMVVDAQAEIVWTWQFGTTAADAATGVAVDANGVITVVGHTAGDLDGTNAGFDDLFVARFEATGGPPTALLQFGTAANDGANGVAVAADGDVVVVGRTSGALRGTSAGGADAFAIRLRPDGSEVWGVQFGTSDSDTANGVAIGSGGEVAVVGLTAGPLFGPHAGATDAFVVRLDDSGETLWSAQLGESGDDAAVGAAFDGRGQLVVVGQTDGPLAGTLFGEFDAFAVRFDDDGTELWRQQFGTDAFEFTTGVAMDAERHALVVGSTLGDLDGPSFGGLDVYVVKLAP